MPEQRFSHLAPYYQQEFTKIAASNEKYRGKWNWAAFFFGPLWALTKGAYLTFLVHAAIGTTILIVTFGFGLPLLIIFPFIYGIRGNYIYYSLVEKKKQIIF